jgi:AraC family transcriptional regulator, regulatory protein of adaptative response / methylated-DNA-[protein]-cysteine methyltransferase
MIHPGFRGAATVFSGATAAMLRLGRGRALPIRKNRVAGRPAETHTGHMTNSEQHPHYELVARAIVALAGGADTSLAALSGRLGVSEFHLQRVFGEWAGVSPKRFMQFISKERALAALRSESDVLGATLSAGVSSPGRLHDLMVTCEGVTPGEARAFGAGLRIRYGAHATALGDAFIGLTERGICHLRFIDETSDPLAELRDEWPEATLVADPAAARQALDALAHPRAPMRLFLKGTNFQIKVWEALLRVPEGELVSYARLATAAGMPTAVRAVASAVAANPVAWLVPCHRVIRSSGVLGQYRWGPERKAALIGWEAARREAA